MGRARGELSDETMRRKAQISARRFLDDLRRVAAPPAEIAETADRQDQRGRRVSPAEPTSGCSSPFAW